MITLNNLITRFGAEELAQLTAPVPGDPLDASVVEAAIAEAEGLVQAVLSARYAWPLAPPVPPLITGAACDLVRALLSRDALPETVERRAADARRLLDQLAAGKLTLGVATAPAPTGVAFTVPGSVMGSSPYST